MKVKMTDKEDGSADLEIEFDMDDGGDIFLSRVLPLIDAAAPRVERGGVAIFLVASEEGRRAAMSIGRLLIENEDRLLALDPVDKAEIENCERGKVFLESALRSVMEALDVEVEERLHAEARTDDGTDMDTPT